jgi:conjugative relaxase-like TrwC/TraI family protein
MLRIIQNVHAAGAKSYYSTADYYSEGQELVGEYRGKGARLLGLTGEVDKVSWDALCDNKHPGSGDKLTPRVKDNRTVGYDFNFHAPKSVSLLYGITRDEKLLDAFRDAMRDTMDDIEAEVQTRVRKNGKSIDRITGNLTWGEFIHFTSRPVDDVPDPHLHGHAFAFNVTFDDAENRWKAAQFRDLKRDAPYYQALFHSRLSRNLAELGLPVERTATGWEITSIDKRTLDKFSRRTQQIEELAKAKGITDPAEKAELGAKTRQKKQDHLSVEELRQQWLSRLSDAESKALARVYARAGGPFVALDHDATSTSVRYAIEHCFERKSVVPERALVAEALKHGMGQVTLSDVRKEIDRRGIITAKRNGRLMATTRQVLDEEKRILDFARKGRGACKALAAGDHRFQRQWLNADQRQAVQHVLSSRDRVTLVRGAAGVGKTSAMQETIEAIEQTGKQVIPVAPSAGASRGVLREKGFSSADTVARLLHDERMQQQLAGQVLWVDEAGLLGSRTMRQLFDLAERVNCRVVLQGDVAQHGSVERGAALRLLETHAGLKSAEIKEIQRQSGDYKAAVRALSEGRVLEGFDRLNGLGWIKEVSDDQRYKALAADYVDTIQSGQSCLVVSPTHAEGRAVTDEIRSHLKRQGRLGAVERTFDTLHNAALTEAQRGDAGQLHAGDVLVFHQNAKGYRKGQRLMVEDQAILPLDQAEHFQLYRRGKVGLAAGDVIRITQNGYTTDKKHGLVNGSLYAVRGFTPAGDIVLNNHWVVGKDYGHIALGYCVTSMASQGKDVNVVLIGQSAESYPASSAEQFYVSASRGQKACRVYCDSKEALREAVNRSEDRLTATELIATASQPSSPSRRRMIAANISIQRSSPRRELEAAYER